MRLRCNYQVSCSTFGKRFNAQVVDMGTEGMRLEMPHHVERGQLIGVRYPGPTICFEFDTVQARVVWSRLRGATFEAGLAYTHPPAYLERSWIRHLLRVFDVDKMSVEDRRREVRVAVSMRAEIAADGDLDGTLATLRDLGLGGALLESPTDLPLGAHVRIQLERPQLTCDGHVVRTRLVRGDRWLVGVRFASASPDLCAGVSQVLMQQP